MSRWPGTDDMGPRESQQVARQQQQEMAAKMDAEERYRRDNLDMAVRRFRGELLNSCPDCTHLSRALRLLTEVEKEALYALGENRMEETRAVEGYADCPPEQGQSLAGMVGGNLPTPARPRRR